MGSAALQPAASAEHRASFDDVVLPHLEAAHRLARWLVRNEHDAEDAVQEATLRAFRYFRTFHGGNGRAWFLRIVRNTCGSCRQARHVARTDAFDEERHSGDRPGANPEALLLQSDAVRVIEHLPGRHRELLILRELEGLSYREMAAAMDMPIGSVMSGLSRARQACRGALADHDRASFADARHRKPDARIWNSRGDGRSVES
jgi:RNA polymerase sigma-70 factor (ECF subfamily)